MTDRYIVDNDADLRLAIRRMAWPVLVEVRRLAAGMGGMVELVGYDLARSVDIRPRLVPELLDELAKHDALSFEALDDGRYRIWCSAR